MTRFLATLLEISLNNATIPIDWKKSYLRRGDRSTVADSIIWYLRQVWDKKDWLYEG